MVNGASWEEDTYVIVEKDAFCFAFSGPVGLDHRILGHHGWGLLRDRPASELPSLRVQSICKRRLGKDISRRWGACQRVAIRFFGVKFRSLPSGNVVLRSKTTGRGPPLQKTVCCVKPISTNWNLESDAPSSEGALELCKLSALQTVIF